VIAWSDGTPTVADRTLHDIFEDAKRADCAYCAALAGEVCAYSGTGPDGLHVGKFAAARKARLISGEDFAAVLRHAQFFTVSTVVYDEKPGGAR
jgi:hypothetical protein